MKQKKTLALIAHDGKKSEMVTFVKSHKSMLQHYNLIATGTTGSLIRETGLKVHCMESGPRGGDAQIAARIVEKKVNAVIFLRDPLGKHPHDPDIFMLLRICDVQNVPVATNLAAATVLLKGLGG
jgi:methylglyoxal synthase